MAIETTLKEYLGSGMEHGWMLRCFAGMIETGEANIDDIKRVCGHSIAVELIKEFSMNESLVKSKHSMQFVVRDLQDAMAKANAVEALLLLDMIETAVKLQHRIESLSTAAEDVKGGRCGIVT